MSKTSALRAVLMLVWSILLTGLTGILGAAPLRVVRRQIGGIPYWLMSIGLVVLFWGLKRPDFAVLLLILSTLVGTQTQAEESGLGLYKSAFLGVASATALVGGMVYFWASKMGSNWLEVLTGEVEFYFARVTEAGILSTADLKAAEIIYHMPSVIVSFLVLSAALGLILEKPFLSFVGMKLPRRQKLVNFKLPESMVWVVIASLPFAFVEMNQPIVQTLSVNFLFVAIVLYFFQGMAILCKYFEVFKVGQLWRAIFVFLFSTQLIFVMSAIGFADFWINFRPFFSKRASELKKRRSVE